MFKWVGAMLLVLALVAPAAAQTLCTSDRTAVIEQLKSRYQEAPVAMGLVGDGSVLEVLAAKSGSWTILVTRPSGLACVVAAGDSWETFPETEADKLVKGPGV
ncbi:MAG: hypothetical protein QF797_10365 [Alphaproteobacteria bacterium]|nr:hypothetical protein [Rhodospirillaceae bacterium]MDP6405601.1 hypothetical protein [Alphaproteobacteria bacterium]|tara:strand:- start:39 stop:347 length:309 start_codon:yes stop_codon:yes gene_type:complete